MKLITKDENKDKRLIAYASVGFVILSILGAFSGKPELFIGLMLTGLAMIALAIVRRQRWFMKAANEASRGNTANFTAIRIGVAIALAIVLISILRFIR